MTEKKTSSFHITCLIFAIIISCFGLNFSSFAVLSVVLVPVAISIVIYCYGFWDSVYFGLAMVLFNAASCFLLNPGMIPVSIVYSVFLCTVGILIGINHVKRLSFKNLFFNLSIFYTLCMTCILAAVKFISKVNITGFFRTFFVEMYTLFFETVGIYYPEVVSSLALPEYDLFNIFFSVLPGLIPFGLITVAMVLSLLQYGFCKMLLNSSFIENSNFSDGFEKFKLSFVSSVFFGVSFLMNNSNVNNMLSMISLNVFAIISVLFILETLSLIYYSLKKTIVSRIVRGIVLAGIMIFTFVVSGFFPLANVFYIFIFVGLSDSIFNYRKLGDRNEKDENQ